MTISMTDDQWMQLVYLFDQMDSAWNMTEDGRDVGQWTIEERYDRLYQGSWAGMLMGLLLDEIEAESAR